MEKASEKMEALEQENADLVAERDALKEDVGNLELQVVNMENDWEEGENKRQEIEAELQEVWNLKDALEQERGKFFSSFSIVVSVLVSTLLARRFCSAGVPDYPRIPQHCAAAGESYCTAGTRETIRER